MDADRALREAGSAWATGRLSRANADAARLGVNSTPTLAVARRGGTPHLLPASALDAAAVARALDAELTR